MVTNKSKQKKQFVTVSGKKYQIKVVAAPQKFGVGSAEINREDSADGSGFLKTFKGERIAVLKPV